MKKREPAPEKAGSKFLRVLNGETAAIPPIWFMRQAGRYLPEYRELRTRAGSFLDLCFNSELASEVTLQPVRRFDLDAAILFSDILVIPWALGQELAFVEGEGPRLFPPVTADRLDGFRERNVVESLSPVMETVRHVRRDLSPDKALIGFAGAPWTVATYMLAGGPMKDPAALRGVYYRDPAFVDGLFEILIAATIDYLVAQIDAGADAVQLFDTWAGGLTSDLTEVFSVIPVMRIADGVKAARPGTPVIAFPKGVGLAAPRYLDAASIDAIGIDFSMDPHWARENLSPKGAVQGGLDPLLVVAGGAAMKAATTSYLQAFDGAPYVFNLGHGFVPETPPEHVAALVEFVRGERWRDG